MQRLQCTIYIGTPKALSDQVLIDNNVYNKTDYFLLRFLCKSDCLEISFFCLKIYNTQSWFPSESDLMVKAAISRKELNLTSQNRKRRYFSHCNSDKGL